MRIRVGIGKPARFAAALKCVRVKVYSISQVSVDGASRKFAEEFSSEGAR